MNARERAARGGMLEDLRTIKSRLDRIVERATTNDGIASSRELRQVGGALERVAVKQGELRALLLDLEE